MSKLGIEACSISPQLDKEGVEAGERGKMKIFCHLLEYREPIYVSPRSRIRSPYVEDLFSCGRGGRAN